MHTPLSSTALVLSTLLSFVTSAAVTITISPHPSRPSAVSVTNRSLPIAENENDELSWNPSAALISENEDGSLSWNPAPKPRPAKRDTPQDLKWKNSQGIVKIYKDPPKQVETRDAEISPPIDSLPAQSISRPALISYLMKAKHVASLKEKRQFDSGAESGKPPKGWKPVKYASRPIYPTTEKGKRQFDSDAEPGKPPKSSGSSSLSVPRIYRFPSLLFSLLGRAAPVRGLALPDTSSMRKQEDHDTLSPSSQNPKRSFQHVFSTTKAAHAAYVEFFWSPIFLDIYAQIALAILGVPASPTPIFSFPSLFSWSTEGEKYHPKQMSTGSLSNEKSKRCNGYTTSSDPYPAACPPAPAPAPAPVSPPTPSCGKFLCPAVPAPKPPTCGEYTTSSDPYPPACTPNNGGGSSLRVPVIFRVPAIVSGMVKRGGAMAVVSKREVSKTTKDAMNGEDGVGVVRRRDFVSWLNTWLTFFAGPTIARGSVLKHTNGTETGK